MKREKIIKAVCRCAELYAKNLAGKNYMVVFATPQEEANVFALEYIELRFTASQFLHLTGIKTKIAAREFYNACLRSRLKDTDFDIAENGTTLQKLAILPDLIRIESSCKMIGGYDNSGPNLRTSCLIGNVKGCFGFRPAKENPNYYIPNTVLKTDMRNKVKERYRVISVLEKDITAKRYKTISYMAKDIDADIVISKLNNNSKCQIRTQPYYDVCR